MLTTAQNFLFRLAKADIAFFLLLPLMLLLFAGTIAQKYIGLYAAHKMFFSSFIFWAGPMPLPGGYLLIGALTFSLSCKFLLKSEWSWKKSGINLTHLGVLVLLGGGLITAMHARENYMVLAEGQESPYIYDYIKRELIISSQGGLRKIPFEKLENANLPFTFELLEKCANCRIEKRAETQQDFGDIPPRGMAQFMALLEKPADIDPEVNLSGLSFKISGLEDENQNGLYIAFEGMPTPININHDGQTYEIIFGKAQRSLPFSLRLKEFEKISYPGTNKAKDYVSELEIIDGNLSWPAHIEMNEPLRYKGYTFYQSSFERSEAGELSILAVVKNRGWLFPYIGSALIGIGLMLHLFLLMRGRES